MFTSNKRLFLIFMTVAVILMIPLVAMQFTSEVNWDITDFIIIGILLSSTGLLCELVLRTVSSIQKRVVICGIILIGVLLIWAELAVGVF